jgi:glycosidase
MPAELAGRELPPEALNDFVGGNLRGVIEKLDYIAGTGATALWLSPVFVTTSYHGYDTTDYYHVDPRFGTDAELVELFAQAHQRGLRVILDFVANHTSVEFPPFVEARNDEHSRYRSWFTFDDAYKHGYRAFFDVAKMPQLNTEEPQVREYLNRAAQHWLALGADGLRLDYAAGPNHLFWSAFRAACRSVKPDCWLFGEVTRAGDILRAYAGRLDGCLDFGFCRSIRMLAAAAPPALSLGQFINQIVHGRHYFGAGANIDFVLPAFIDNHDMNRFLWVANGDKQRLRLALGLLFALGGPPVLYYGTEVGLSQPRAKGPRREESRHPMLWDEQQDRDLLAYVRAWSHARRMHPSLGRGSVQTLYYGEEQGAWLGELRWGEDVTLLAVNIGDAGAKLPLPAGRYQTIFGDALAGEDDYVQAPLSVSCLLPSTAAGG